ncbi:MAG: alpha/beta hydrolase [Planctomycetota bacterium]|nr:alpha/beta hydrolase [Planctomycetota bacterium]
MSEIKINLAPRGSKAAGEIHVKRVGSGPALMLVHGFPFSSGMWWNQVDGLADRFDLVIPDLRGFGQSSDLESGWEIRDFADDLARATQFLKIESLIYCGLSLGGYVGFELLSKYPELISKIVLCNTRASIDDQATARGRRLMAERVRREGTGFVKPTMLPRLLAKPNAGKVRVTGLDGLFEGLRAESIAQTQIAMANRRNFAPLLHSIDLPVTLIAGEGDAITPVTEMSGMAAGIEGAELHVVSNAGHLTPIENPEEFNQVLNGLS